MMKKQISEKCQNQRVNEESFQIVYTVWYQLLKGMKKEWRDYLQIYLENYGLL